MAGRGRPDCLQSLTLTNIKAAALIGGHTQPRASLSAGIRANAPTTTASASTNTNAEPPWRRDAVDLPPCPDHHSTGSSSIANTSASNDEAARNPSPACRNMSSESADAVHGAEQAEPRHQRDCSEPLVAQDDVHEIAGNRRHAETRREA